MNGQFARDVRQSGLRARVALCAIVGSTLLLAAPAWARRTETASFRSTPEGARVYLDGKYVGDTPLDLTFDCDAVADREYRIEREGCTGTSGILNARVGAGRIVGAAFSLGISLIFKCPQYFVPVRVALDCGEPRQVPISVNELPPPRNLRRERAQQRERAIKPADIEPRLNALKDLRDRGVITEEEYLREREILLRSLGY